ncbi:hypothetical protein TNCV_2615221 [Trichonephila clavipes]|nr:hypothetical protein TNCV_2615221 [Trichonephila clavipes]
MFVQGKILAVNLAINALKCLRRAVGSPVVRTLDSRPEGQDSECWGQENISLPFSSMPKLRRWRQVVSLSVIPSGNFTELILTVTCMKYGKFIEDCIPDRVFPIGDDVFVFASTYNDSVSVHIRRFKRYERTYYPTPEGIMLDPRWIEYIMRKNKVQDHWRNYQLDFSLLNDTFKNQVRTSLILLLSALNTAWIQIPHLKKSPNPESSGLK